MTPQPVTGVLPPLEVCPSLPAGAQAAIDTINSYVLGGVVAMFITVAVVGIGSIVLGRVMHNPHLSKGGVITLVVAAVAAAMLPVIMPIITGLIGSGCIA